MDKHLHIVTRWVGGKWRNSEMFESLLPVGIENMFYVEPFVGSGALLIKTQPRRALISDINSTLIQMYLDIKERPDELIAELAIHAGQDNEGHYYKVRDDEFNPLKLGKIPPESSPVKQSARFIYLNARCYNGLYRESLSGKMNAPFGKDLKGMKNINDVQNIRGLSSYFNGNNIHIENVSYEESISLAGRFANGSVAFFFLDPPYYPTSQTSSFTAYNKDFWSHDNFVGLRDFVDGIDSEGWLFLLCNSSVDEIKEIFDGYHQIEHTVPRSVSCKARDRKPAVEIVISNYEIERRRKEVDTL